MVKCKFKSKDFKFCLKSGRFENETECLGKIYCKDNIKKHHMK